MLASIDVEPMLHRLWFVDETTPGSRAKPAGAQFCEIHEQVVLPGSAALAPTDPETMPLLANDTKPPYRNDFSADQKGGTAYYAMRWVNTGGDAGPWSSITSHPII